MDASHSSNAKSELGIFSSSYLNVLLAHMRRRGLEVDEFLRLAGLTQQSVKSKSYSLDDLIRYCHLAITFSGDELFPIRAGRRMQLAEFQVLGALAMHAPTMKNVLEDSVFFINQTSKGELSVNIVCEDGRGYIRFFPADGYSEEDLGPLMDMIMASVAYNCLIIAHEFNVADLADSEVYFRRSPHQDVERVKSLFQLSTVQYGHEFNQLSIDEGFLNQPLSSADPDTYKTMKTMMEKTAAVYAKEMSIVDRVETLLSTTQKPNLCSINDIAAMLDLSKSTLQRKLKAEGLTFRGLQAQVIETRAKHLLSTTEQSVQEIALSLGYVEITSFHRAFKRWVNMTPAEYRERH